MDVDPEAPSSASQGQLTSPLILAGEKATHEQPPSIWISPTTPPALVDNLMDQPIETVPGESSNQFPEVSPEAPSVASQGQLTSSLILAGEKTTSEQPPSIWISPKTPPVLILGDVMGEPIEPVPGGSSNQFPEVSVPLPFVDDGMAQVVRYRHPHSQSANT